MSSSSLWIMDKDYYGYEDTEFINSWLFSPIAWDVLLEKYMPYANRNPYDGGKIVNFTGNLDYFNGGI